MDTGAYTEHPWHYLSGRYLLRFALYVVVINTLIALFLTMTGISKSFPESFVMAQSYGILISSIVVLLHLIFRPTRRLAGHVLIIAAAICGGYPFASLIGAFVLNRFFSIAFNPQGSDLLQGVTLCVSFGAVVSYFFYSQARMRVIREMIQQERITRLSSEKAALEANLRLLQAQIEPHFLFNTLSNVLSLVDRDPVKGKAMLTDLIHYLRTSLSRTLPDSTTLDQEMAIIRAYLNIHKVRMGERLRFVIEVPDASLLRPFPPMLLQPLVENAIKHGIEPQMEGGEIIIKTTEKEDLMRIEVADTGAGFSSFQKTGVGIANVRERIRLLYGEQGRLLFEENEPHGIRAVIEVPKHEV